MSRGLKQGNNAFTDKIFTEHGSDHIQNYAKSYSFMSFISKTPGIDVKTILSLNRSVPDFGKEFHDKINDVAAAGNIKFLELIIESNIKGGRGK